jgi:serine/threonine protein kinase
MAASQVLRGPRGHDKKLFETEVTHLRLASALPESVRLVRLVDSFQDDTHYGCRCIVIKPLCEGGNIEQLLKKRPMSYTLPDCMRWLHEVSESLYLLGTKVKMYHGDINPRAYLLSEWLNERPKNLSTHYQGHNLRVILSFREYSAQRGERQTTACVCCRLWLVCPHTSIWDGL